MITTHSKTVELKPGVQFDKDWLRDTLHVTEEQAELTSVGQFDAVILFGQLYKLDAQELTRLLTIVFPEDDMITMLTKGDHSYSLQSYVADLAEALEIDQQITFSPEKTHEERESLFTALFDAHQVGITDLVVKISEKFSKFLRTLPGHESKLEVQRLNRVNRRTNLPVMQRPRIQHSSLLPNLLIIDVSGSQGYDLIESVVDNCISLAVKYEMHLALVSHIAEWYVPGTYDRDTVLNSPCMDGGTRYAALAEIGVASEQWGTVVTLADVDGQRSDMQAWQLAGGSIEQVVDISTVDSQTWLSEIVACQSSNTVRQLVVAPTSFAQQQAYEESVLDEQDEPFDYCEFYGTGEAYA